MPHACMHASRVPQRSAARARLGPSISSADSGAEPTWGAERGSARAREPQARASPNAALHIQCCFTSNMFFEVYRTKRSAPKLHGI